MHTAREKSGENMIWDMYAINHGQFSKVVTFQDLRYAWCYGLRKIDTCKSPSIKETRRAEKTYATSSLTHGQCDTAPQRQTPGAHREPLQKIYFFPMIVASKNLNSQWTIFIRDTPASSPRPFKKKSTAATARNSLCSK